MKSSMQMLLLEDDQIEIMKFERVIQTLNASYQVQIAKDGEEAMNYLQTCTEQLPTLILLDLNMPKFNGIEFLKALKKQDRLYHIPCVVLTTSDNNVDLIECYQEGIAGYFLKPLRYEEYVDLVCMILNYWEKSQRVKA
jgi:CheY-like chemotaxis protein